MNQGFDFIKRLPDRMDPVAVAMACDDAMLSLAEKGIATIRIYYWGKPELSLGYFQPATALGQTVHGGGSPASSL